MAGLLDHRQPKTMVASVGGLPSSSSNSKEYRTIWISDFHLGTSRCKAEALSDFLRNHRAETLFLVGDILDGWSMGPGWCWTPQQTAVVEEIWAWRRGGSRIIFLPGNHDENDSELVRMLFGTIEIVPHLLHRTADNGRMLVIHGHQFDSPFHGSRWMSAMGSIGYASALRLNVWYNRKGIPKPDLKADICRAGGLRQWIKRTIHQLVDFPTPA